MRQIALEDLWERQHELTSILAKARVGIILEAMMEKTSLGPSAQNSWQLAQGWHGSSEEVHCSPRVDAIKASFLFSPSNYKGLPCLHFGESPLLPT